MVARALHFPAAMNALKLLTSQHTEIDRLADEVAASRDPVVRSARFGALCDLLTIHLMIEQELLYPAIAHQLRHGIHDELLAEHAEIKRVLADLVWYELDDPQFDRRLAQLAELLDGHSQWQDEELFATIVETMPADALATLGARLRTCVDSPGAVGSTVALSAA